MNKLEKYNPDVVKKYEVITRERESTPFTFSKQVYKGITNDFPNQINGPDDLKIKTHEPDYDLIKTKMDASLKEREREKVEQERLLLKLSEQKTQKKLVININSTNEVQETYQDMKNSHQKYTINKNDKLIKEKSILNDVMDFLKKI
jgi:uncharacterized ubiquitin-like protein YukD